MAPDNFVAITGRLTRDPELKFVGPKGTALCNFSIGQNEKVGTGSKAHFFDAKAWGWVAENVANNFKKGQPITIIGRLDFESWEAQGQKKHRHTIRAEQVNVPLFKSDSGAAAGAAPAPGQPAAAATAPAAPETADDVPF